MDFFYPNWNNDMWRIFGLLFFGDKDHFADVKRKVFLKDALVDFLQEKGVALYDTATAVRRLKNNASDKYLEVVEQTDIRRLLASIPHCSTIVTTGEKATETICRCLDVPQIPAVGTYVEFSLAHRRMRLYRMPSSSRAYPLSLERKASFYRVLFEEACDVSLAK